MTASTRIMLILLVSLAGILHMTAQSQQTTESVFDKLPPDFRPIDPKVKSLLEAFGDATEQGEPEKARTVLDQALNISSHGYIGDRALVEAAFGTQEFFAGHFEEAEKYFDLALEHAEKAGNSALKADLLVSRASRPRLDSRWSEADELLDRAEKEAETCKSVYVMARVYSERASVLFAQGKIKEAQSYIEKALRIDEINDFVFKPLHLVYEAQILLAESPDNLEKSAAILKDAIELAPNKKSYTALALATCQLATIYLAKNQPSDAIRIISRAMQGKRPLASDDETIKALQVSASSPLIKSVLLVGLASAYAKTSDNQRALDTWQELRQYAEQQKLTEVEAGAAGELARIYAASSKPADADYYYQLAVTRWRSLQYRKQLEDALATYSDFLVASQNLDKATKVQEELVRSADTSKNTPLLFTSTLQLGRIYAQLKDTAKAESLFRECETQSYSLYREGVSEDWRSDRLVDLHLAYADLLRQLSRPVEMIIQTEKAALIVNGGKDEKRRQVLLQALKGFIKILQPMKLAEEHLQKNELSLALTFYEIQDAYDVFRMKEERNDRDALRWLMEIPFKMTKTDEGAQQLADNLSFMGDVAGPVNRVGSDALMRFYLSKRNPKLAVLHGNLAIAFIDGRRDEQLNEADVQMLCLYSWAAYLAGEDSNAKKQSSRCLNGARRLQESAPRLFQMASAVYSKIVLYSDPASAEQAIASLLTTNTADPDARADLASSLAQQGKLQDALKTFEGALAIYVQDKNLLGQGKIHLQIAQSLNIASDRQLLNEGSAHAAAAAKLFAQLNDSSHEVEALIQQSIFASKTGNKRQILTFLSTAETMAEGSKNNSSIAAVANRYGDYFDEIGLKDKAEQSYQKAFDFYASAGNLSSQAFAGLRLAAVMQKRSENDKALEVYVNSRRIAEKSGSWAAEYWTIKGLGEFYQSVGDYQRAVEWFLTAKDVAGQVGQAKNEIYAAHSLAWAYLTLGEWGLALDEAKASLALSRRIKDNMSEFRSLMLLMNIFGDRRSELKDLDKALSLYGEIESLAATNKDIDLSEIDDVLAEVYWQTQRYDDAARRSEAAVKYYESQKDDYGAANALMSLAEAQRREGKLQEAVMSLHKAEQRAGKLQDAYTNGRLRYTKAGICRAQKNFECARQAFLEVFEYFDLLKANVKDTNERRKLADTYNFVYEDFVESLLAQSRFGQDQSAAAQALAYSELNKAQAFLYSWGAIFSREASRQLPVALQDRERDLVSKQAVAVASLQHGLEGVGDSKETIEQLRAAVQDRSKDLAEFANEIWREYPRYASVRFPRLLSINQIPLRPDEMLVSWKVTDYGTFVWFVRDTSGRPSVIRFYKSSATREWLNVKVSQLRASLDGSSSQNEAKLIEELTAALFPGDSLRELQTAKTLVFVPDQALFLFPFELLSSKASSNNFPLIGIPSIYFPSISALVMSRNTEREKKWDAELFAVADPIIAKSTGETRGPRLLFAKRGLKLDRIPGTVNEVNGIASLLPSTAKKELRIGQAATKESVLATDLSRFRFIHLATHGLLPMDSGLTEPGLVFSSTSEKTEDQILQMSEILKLNLTADSVVLSACNTGSGNVGRAEGVSNLGRAFMMAGASSAVVSLWQVADESTALLMKEYYRHILEGKSKAESLALSRSYLLAHGYKDPFFWAPFILMGD